MQTGLGKTFWRLGWLGFWAQIGIVLVSGGLMGYAFIFDSQGGFGTRGQLAMIEYLSIAGLLILIFTTFWFYRYTRLAARIADPERHPGVRAIQRIAWIGVVATTANVVFSMLVTLFEVIQLFVYFLRAPKAGIPVVQTTGGPASWVSAGDILSLLVLILTMAVEVVMVVFSLWLLYRVTVASTEISQSLTAEAAA